jgi:hypothetical protein
VSLQNEVKHTEKQAGIAKQMLENKSIYSLQMDV